MKTFPEQKKILVKPEPFYCTMLLKVEDVGGRISQNAVTRTCVYALNKKDRVCLSKN